MAFPEDLVTLENNLTGKLSAAEARLKTGIDAVEIRVDTVEVRLETKIDTLKTELRLDLGGKIETLKWMFGALVALNIGILIRVLYIH